MEAWTADAVILDRRAHGESSAIVDFFTRDHGRYGGLVRGGNARRLKPALQPGNMVQASWRARLSEHLGTATIDPGRAYAAEVLTDQVLLAGLSAMCALLKIVPERQAYPRLFDTVMVLLEALENRQVWLPLFVRFELALLEEVGFGLDLSACAATGTNEDLTHVSPRSGRAISREAAEPYAERMFVLPAFLLSADAPADADDVLQGLNLTGHFLERRVYGVDTSGIPAARERFVEILRSKGVPA